MFSRKIQVRYEVAGASEPCPLKWLDSFAMRNFTNNSIFDDTLPLRDGMIEVGSRVPIDELNHAMEDWFRRKGYLPVGAVLVAIEIGSPAAPLQLK